MTNIASSATKQNTKNENNAATNLDPNFLQALQDLATYFNVEIWGSYAKSGVAPVNGDTFKGTFHVKK